MAHMRGIGPVHVEPVSVGIFLKRARTFAELRPMTKWVALSFSLPRAASHKAIRRKIIKQNGCLLYTSMDDVYSGHRRIV